jgi:ribonuclease P/MRP protein subunit RPP1
MYFDLNVPVPQPASLAASAAQPSKKANKGKQAQASTASSPTVSFSHVQIIAIEARVDMLVHCPYSQLQMTVLHGRPDVPGLVGYTVLAFTQTVQKKVEQRTHANILDPLLAQLQKREGIVYLKRLTIVLDEDSEKGFGLVRVSLLRPKTNGSTSRMPHRLTQTRRSSRHTTSLRSRR